MSPDELEAAVCALFASHAARPPHAGCRCSATCSGSRLGCASCGPAAACSSSACPGQMAAQRMRPNTAPHAAVEVLLRRYLKGDIYLPVWGAQTTTESRLVVLQEDIDTCMNYDHRCSATSSCAAHLTFCAQVLRRTNVFLQRVQVPQRASRIAAPSLSEPSSSCSSTRTAASTSIFMTCATCVPPSLILAPACLC
jgi:hypothetical protein